MDVHSLETNAMPDCGLSTTVYQSGAHLGSAYLDKLNYSLACLSRVSVQRLVNVEQINVVASFE